MPTTGFGTVVGNGDENGDGPLLPQQQSLDAMTLCGQQIMLH